MPRLTVDLLEEIDEALNDIAKRNGVTTATAMRRAFAQLVVVETQKKKKEVSLSTSSGKRTIAPLRLLVARWVPDEQNQWHR